MTVVDLDLDFDALTLLRQDIHRHPEVAFEEHRTAALVAQRLTELGIEVHTGIGQTGVVGVLHGRSNASGKRIALRADMDALPMPDHKDVPYRSSYDGKMHGCGHDGHTTMLLGAAGWLARERAFDGTIVFIFQPAEEGAGGAQAMMADGFLERFPVDSVWGLHNWPGVPFGKVVVHSAECMASVDYFDIDVIGKGCHGGMPHEGVDPVLAAAHVVVALQSIPTRNVHPADACVISAAKIHGGDAYHVVPEKVVVSGSVRALKEPVRQVAQRRVHEVAAAAALSVGAEVSVRYRPNYPSTINHPALTGVAEEVARKAFGEDVIHPGMLPSMASEDFSFFSRERPGCYVWIGSDDDTHHHSLHHPMYDFNDRLIPKGIAYWTGLVQRVLPLTE